MKVAVNLSWALLSLLGSVANVTGLVNLQGKVNGLWLVVAAAFGFQGCYL
jgi:Flp pilus assembly pilin Flp